ncbi:hypothetical protein ACLOJK_037096 [Asimina triloba]
MLHPCILFFRRLSHRIIRPRSVSGVAPRTVARRSREVGSAQAGRRMRQLGPGCDEGPGQLPAPVTLHTVVRTGRAACRWKRRDGTYVVGSCSAAGPARRARILPSGGPTAQRRGHGAVCLRELSSANLTGAIIPALMHRIPSELRSYACLGESSTRMGDLLGSPCVAPLHPFFSPLVPSDYETAFRFGRRSPHRRAKVPRSRIRVSGPPYAPARAWLRRRSGPTSGARNIAHRRPDGTCSMSLKRRDGTYVEGSCYDAGPSHRARILSSGWPTVQHWVTAPCG